MELLVCHVRLCRLVCRVSWCHCGRSVTLRLLGSCMHFILIGWNVVSPRIVLCRKLHATCWNSVCPFLVEWFAPDAACHNIGVLSASWVALPLEVHFRNKHRRLVHAN